MSYDEYWNGDPYLIYAYYEAEKMRQERQNAEAWLAGMYIAKAVDSVLSQSELFRAKGSKPRPYPSEPFDLHPQGKTEEEKKKEAQNERLRAIAHFNALIRINKARRGDT